MAEANYEELPRPEYTEFGIKFHKLRVTFKVQRRSSSTEAEGRGRGGRGGRGRREERVARDRAHSTGGDSLRLLNLDTTAGSRRPIVHDGSGNSGARLANWEFEVSHELIAAISKPRILICSKLKRKLTFYLLWPREKKVVLISCPLFSGFLLTPGQDFNSILWLFFSRGQPHLVLF